MSASDKKKLRREQAAQILSEKQRQEQAEAKKLKIYTISFVSAMAVVLCIALAVLGVRAVNQSGVFQKSTVAATIGEHKLNSVEMGYYYMDAVQNFYSEWYEQYTTYTDTYLQMMGFDTTKPLTEQYYNADENQTWADFFLDEALTQAKEDYALYDKAMSENFELPEEERTTVDNVVNNMETYAKLYGYSSAGKYLSAMYGFGSDVKSYQTYLERSAIASAYYDTHKESLKYEDSDLRDYEADKYDNFNSYNYHSSFLSYTEFLEGGTEDEEGNKTYSEDEKKAAREKMTAEAEKAAAATTLDELKEKIDAVDVNEDSQTALNAATGMLHTETHEVLGKWLASDERKEGDIAALPVTTVTKNEAGEEVAELTGYYIAYFISKNENTEPMGNVRHLLVKFEGGTDDEETGEKVYSEEEMNAAKEKADGYLKTWQEGEKTEDSFIALVKEHSDDSSAEEGGLFEDINPDSEYVSEFLNWSINPDRQKGDAEVIKTQYGYHVMYYVGDDDLSYRDYMIENEMRDAAQEEWYKGIIDPVTPELADTSKMTLDLVMSSSY